jgi:hypothetical protein
MAAECCQTSYDSDRSDGSYDLSAQYDLDSELIRSQGSVTLTLVLERVNIVSTKTALCYKSNLQN